jgi:hypothetical protein
MSIKKFHATADTTITNAYKEGIRLRGTEANMGLSDILEVFFLYGQSLDIEATLEDKLEEARILIKFDTAAITTFYGATAPADTKFILKLTNAAHPFTLARNYDLRVYHLGAPFVEGNGLDMESYKDVDVANWTNSATATAWANPGASPTPVFTDATPIVAQTFDTGTENLEVDITAYIDDIFDGTIATDNGLLIAISPTITDGSQLNNFYTKKFFSRSSEFFFKRPVIEARKASFTGDDRGRLYKSSPLTASNEQSLYLYNTVSGVRESVTGTVALTLYSDSAMTALIATGTVTSPETGVYKAAVTIPDTVLVTTIYEKWTADATTTIKTGSIKLLTREPETNAGEIDYRIDITNMKPSYTREETAKFRLYTRAKDWNPTIYTVASKEVENLIVEKAYYKIVRLVDDETVVKYGIGTAGTNKEHTLISYDASGSYFDFDMSLLEKGYMYGIKVMFSINGELKEQPEIFKFRVD